MSGYIINADIVYIQPDLVVPTFSRSWLCKLYPEAYPILQNGNPNKFLDNS